MGANLSIQGTDRLACTFECGADRSVSRGRTFVEISDIQGQEKFLQSLSVSFDVLAFGYPMAKLGQGDRRDADVPRGQPIEASQGLRRFPFDEGDTDIGIEHVSHQNGSRF
jgi:hypothetical protein